MSRISVPILKKNNRVAAEREQTDQDKNSDRDEDDVAGGEETLENSVVIGTEQQRPHGNKSSTKKQVDVDKFIERARTHLAHEIDLTWASKQTPKNIVKEMTKSKYDNLEDLFEGTERDVLYRVNHLIHQRIDLNANVFDDSGDGILHFAVKKKFVKVAERLLDNGAPLNTINKDKYTPLHLALGCCYCGRKMPSKETEEPCCCSWFKNIREYVKTNFGEDDEDLNTRKNTNQDAKSNETQNIGKDGEDHKPEKNTNQEAKCPKGHKTSKNTNQDAKCDEMAALMIRKLKPCYVRYLFGDDIDFENSEKPDETGRKTANTSGKTDETGRNTANRSGKPDKTERNTANSSGKPDETERNTAHTSGKTDETGRSTANTSVTSEAIRSNGPAKTSYSIPGSLLSKENHNRDTVPGLRFGSFNFLEIIKDKDLQTTTCTILDKLEDTDRPIPKPVVYYTLLTTDKTSDTETAGTNNTEEEVFQYIARRRPKLIKHPVVRAVIHWKWKRKFHRRYLFDFFQFFLSFIAITICAVVGAQSDGVHVYDSPWQYTRAALEILSCIFIFDTFRSELLQCYIDPKDYVTSVLNWMEVGSAVCLTVSIGLRYSDVNAHWYLFAVGYVLWTVKGLKYCAIYRHADAYKETLRALIKRDLFLFTVFFVALEMVFGGTLLLVLRGTNSLNVEPDTESILSIYYIGLRTMIDGSTPESLNVDNLPRVGEFVIIVFNSLTIVIMLNILIAQLSNTYETAYLDGQIKSWVNRAEAIVSYEKEDGCIPFGGIRLFRCYCKRSPIQGGKIPFDKEQLLEEKEKEEEMRAILKQVDNTLLHTDLSVQTIKTKQTALLQAKTGRPETLTNDSQDQGGLRRDFNKLATQFSEVKAQQESILEAVGEIRKLLRKQE